MVEQIPLFMSSLFLFQLVDHYIPVGLYMLVGFYGLVGIYELIGLYKLVSHLLFH